MSERVEFVFVANANGAIQAFQAIGAEAGKAGANVDKLGTQGAAGLQKVEVAAGKASGSFGKLGQAASTLGGVASGVIGSTLVGFLSDAARAAAEAEASTARLQQAFDNAGTSTDAYAAELQRASDAALQLAFDDEDAADAIATMTGITGDAAQSIDLLSTAMDLARARNISLSQAATIVGRVAAGNTQILSRYGIVIDENATATEALAALQQRYGGQAEAYGRTQAAAIDRMRVGWDNFVETIGGALGPLTSVLGVLPGVSVAFQSIGGAVGGLMSGSSSLPALIAKFGPLAAGAGAAGIAVVALGAAFLKARDDAAALEQSLTDVNRALDSVDSTALIGQFQDLRVSAEEAQAAIEAGDPSLQWGRDEDVARFNDRLADVVDMAEEVDYNLGRVAITTQTLLDAWAADPRNFTFEEATKTLDDYFTVLENGSPKALADLMELDKGLESGTLTPEQYAEAMGKVADAVMQPGDPMRKLAEDVEDVGKASEATLPRIVDLAKAIEDTYSTMNNVGGGSLEVLSNDEFWARRNQAAADEAMAAAKAIDQLAEDAIDAAKRQEEEVVAAAEAQADAVVAAAEKAADAQIRAAEKAGKSQVRAAEQAGKDQIRAAERAEAGQVRAAEQAADAQIAAAEAAAEGQIDAARKAEEAQVEAAEKAANAQIRAAEQAEKSVARAAQKQANQQIRAAEQAASRQVAAAQRAADQMIAQADALEEQASAAAQAQEDRTVASAQRAHDKRVAAAENAADREIAAAQRATEETLAQIDQRLAAANRQATTTANVEINAANDAAFKKISDAAAKYGEDSVEYEKAVAEATDELARKQEEAYQKQAEAQRKAAEEAAEAQREAEREEQRRIAQAERARDRAIARSAAKQQAIEERAHQETLRRQEEAARQAEALREEAARRVAAAEQQAARQVEQVRREAQRELARKEREAARQTADVRRQIEQNLAAQREAAAARTAAVEEAAAANVEAARIQAERNVQVAAREAARETEKVRREVAQNVRAAERETAQEVRAITKETARIQKEQAAEVSAVVAEEAAKRQAAEEGIAAAAETAAERVLTSYAEMDPAIADILEAKGAIQEGATGEWEIVFDDPTRQALEAIDKVFGEDGTLDAQGRVTIATNTDPLMRYIESLRRLYASGASVANVRVNVVPDTRYVGRADGGLVAAADGRTVLVGEAGPELVQLPVGSRVTASPASRAMLAAGGGGMGGISITIQGDVYGMPDFERKVGEAAANVLGRALPQAMADRRRALGVA